MRNKDFKFALLLCTIISCVYVLRLNDASPSNFLQETFIRALQEVIQPPPNEPLCDGVTFTPVTEDQIQNSLDIRSQLSNIQSTNKLLEFILGPDPKNELGSDYIGPLVGKSVQWIVFFGIGVVLLLLCLIAFVWAWCSARSRLKHGKVITVGRGIKLYMWMSVVFLVPLLGAAIAVLIFTTTQVHTGVDKSVCAIAIFGDQIEFGDLEQNWIGTTPLRNQTIAAVAVLPATVSNLSYPALTGISDRASVNRALTTVSGSVTTFYNNNEGQTIDRADPVFTTPYEPTYIENLGPPSNSSTESGQIQAEMQQKRDVVVRASQNLTVAIAALQALALAPSVVQPILTELVTGVVALAASVSSANAQLKDYAQDVLDIVDALVIAMIVVFSVDIGFVVVALLGIVLLCVGVKWVRRFVHLSWCMIGLLMTFTWALATLFWMCALVLNDVCGVTNAILVDPSVYNATANKFFPEPQYALSKAIVYNCFYGDGNVLGVLGQAQDLAPFAAIFASLDNTANLTEALGPVPDSIVIPAEQFEVSQIQSGLVSDSPLTTEDLNNLNTFTHHDTNGCTQIEDTWILNAANCTDSMSTVFPATSPADFNVGNPTCIGFNNWGTKEIDERYNDNTFPQPSCGLIDGDEAAVGLTNYVDSFVTHQQNVGAVFGNVQSGLSDVATANAAYMNTITAATANIAPIWNQTSQIYPFLGDPVTGIIPNSQCAFLRSSFVMAENQICVRLLPGVYRDMISLIVGAFMGLFALPFLFCFSKRLLQFRKQDKAVEMGRQGSGAYKT